MADSIIGVAAIGAMGTKAPPDKERNLSEEPKSIEVFILIQGISSRCLKGYHFQINAYPCLLLYEYEIHFKPACLGLDVCLLQAVIIIIFLLRDNILNIYIRESYWMLVNFQCGWQSCSCGSSTHSLKSRRPLTSIPLIFPGLLKLESSVATNSSKILTLSSQTPPPQGKILFHIETKCLMALMLDLCSLQISLLNFNSSPL